VGDLIIAAKVAASFWAATALFAAYLLIRSFGCGDTSWRRFAWVWVIVLAASSPTMLFRLSTTPRPISQSAVSDCRDPSHGKGTTPLAPASRISSMPALQWFVILTNLSSVYADALGSWIVALSGLPAFTR